MPLNYLANSPWSEAAAQGESIGGGITGLMGQLAALQLSRQQYADQMRLRMAELDLQNRLYQSHQGLYNAQAAKALLENQQVQRNMDLARAVGAAAARRQWGQSYVPPPLSDSIGEPTMANSARLGDAQADSDIMGGLTEIAAMHPSSAQAMLMHNVPEGAIAGNALGQTLIRNPKALEVGPNSVAYTPEGDVRMGVITTPYGGLSTPPVGEPIKNERIPGDTNAGAASALVKAVADGTMDENELSKMYGPQAARAIMENVGRIMMTVGNVSNTNLPAMTKPQVLPSKEAARKEAQELVKKFPAKVADIKLRFRQTYGENL